MYDDNCWLILLTIYSIISLIHLNTSTKGVEALGKTVTSYNSGDQIDIDSDFDSFLIGRANDGKRNNEREDGSPTQSAVFTIDEFQFWPRRMSIKEIKELGMFEDQISINNYAIYYNCIKWYNYF